MKKHCELRIALQAQGARKRQKAKGSNCGFRIGDCGLRIEGKARKGEAWGMEHRVNRQRSEVRGQMTEGIGR